MTRVKLLDVPYDSSYIGYAEREVRRPPLVVQPITPAPLKPDQPPWHARARESLPTVPLYTAPHPHTTGKMGQKFSVSVSVSLFSCVLWKMGQKIVSRFLRALERRRLIGLIKYISGNVPRARPSCALCHYRTVPQLVPGVLLAAASRAMGSCSRHSCRQKTQSSSASASSHR